jgi:hypothetical protein
MEKIFLNKRVVVIAFFTVFSTTVSQAMIAYDKPAVELKLIRWVKDQPIFQFTFTGQSESDKFTLLVRDELNNTIYRQNIIGQHFTKSFLLNIPEISDDTLNFEIVHKKSNSSKIYRINRHTFIREEIA